MKLDSVLMMDIVILLFGLYILYATIRMKKKGVIDKMLMAESEIKKIKAKDGFIQYMSPHLIVFSSLVIVDGIFGIITDEFVKIPYSNWIIMVTFLIAVIYLLNRIRVSKEKF